MGLPHDVSRCHGDYAGRICRQRADCERYRQLGRDQMAPKGAVPAWVPVAAYLGHPEGPGDACPQRIAPASREIGSPSGERGQGAVTVVETGENAPVGRGDEA